MSTALRDQAGTLALVVGIFYVVCFIGWLFRDHLGIPRSRLKHFWVALIVVPVIAALMLALYAVVPRWTHSLVAIVLLGAVVPWVRSRQHARELADPLCGREALVVRGQPADLQVQVDGELWSARPEEGLVVFAGERVLIRRREGVRLVVGR